MHPRLPAQSLLLWWGSYRWTRNLWVLIIYLFFLMAMLPSVVPRLATDLAVRLSPGVWKLLSFLRLPSWDGSPSLPLLSLFLSFIFFSYLHLKTMGCFSGCLLSSASIQKLFCGIFWASKCSFDEFVGEKVVSPSYSSTILGLPPSINTFYLSSMAFKVWCIFYVYSTSQLRLTTFQVLNNYM